MSDLYSQEYRSLFQDCKSGGMTLYDLSFRKVTLAAVWRRSMSRARHREDSSEAIEAIPVRKHSKVVTRRTKQNREAKDI